MFDLENTLLVSVKSSYDLIDMFQFKQDLNDTRLALSPAPGKSLAVRRFHTIIESGIARVDPAISIDGSSPLRNVKLPQLRRRAFSNLMLAPIDPGLMNIRQDSWMFVDIGLQVVRNLYHL